MVSGPSQRREERLGPSSPPPGNGSDGATTPKCSRCRWTSASINLKKVRSLEERFKSEERNKEGWKSASRVLTITQVTCDLAQLLPSIVRTDVAIRELFEEVFFSRGEIRSWKKNAKRLLQELFCLSATYSQFGQSSPECLSLESWPACGPLVTCCLGACLEEWTVSKDHQEEAETREW